MLGLRERMEENGIAPGSGEAKRSAADPADPEVVDRPLRRWFAPSYKLRIVEEADRCTEPGEVGQLLRREGLYSSHLTTWRKAAHTGSLKALSKKRGRKPERNPLEEKVRKLERENTRLEKELEKAQPDHRRPGKSCRAAGIEPRGRDELSEGGRGAGYARRGEARVRCACRWPEPPFYARRQLRGHRPGISSPARRRMPVTA